jgi:hypothetical protein
VFVFVDHKDRDLYFCEELLSIKLPASGNLRDNKGRKPKTIASNLSKETLTSQ